MIDQVTRRRVMRTGLTAYDPNRACPGYVLFCPYWVEEGIERGRAHLIDLQGNLVHQWELSYPPRFWGYLLPNGNLFYVGQLSRDPHEFPGWRNEIGGTLVEVDWDGDIVWEHRDRDQHHDGRRTLSGGALYLNLERMPDDAKGQVKGGIPGSDEKGMWADVLVEVDSSGRRIWEWHAYQHLDFDKHILPPNVRRHEWSHANTIVPLAGDQVLVSFRHISTIMIIDKGSGDILWSIGHETVSGQHDASLLPNGHVLAFDNGLFRSDTHATYSRVVEINRTNNKVVWSYEDPSPLSFYSPFIGGAQRLPNGNTLVTEGWFGRVFQVTSSGDVVWEYINPYFFAWEGGRRVWNNVFRARHYQAEELPGLR